MNAIGITLGRLSPPIEERIQAFPRQTWPEEFERASLAELDCIEWIYDLKGADLNPIASKEGIREILVLSEKFCMAVRSLCVDYLMERPLLGVTQTDAIRSSETVMWLLKQCHLAGIQRLVVPFLGSNAIYTEPQIVQVAQQIAGWLPLAEKLGMEIHLETSLDPARFKQLLDTIAHPMVKVTYDVGNSVHFGFVASEEFDAYGMSIGSVHVKDSKLHGTTVPLGTGDADFKYCFQYIAAIGYQGDYILQAARVPDLDEVELAKRHRAFVCSYLTRSSIVDTRGGVKA